MEQPPDETPSVPPGAPPPTRAPQLPRRPLPRPQPSQTSPARPPTTPSLTPSAAPTPSAARRRRRRRRQHRRVVVHCARRVGGAWARAAGTQRATGLAVSQVTPSLGALQGRRRRGGRGTRHTSMRDGATGASARRACRAAPYCAQSWRVARRCMAASHGPRPAARCGGLTPSIDAVGATVSVAAAVGRKSDAAGATQATRRGVASSGAAGGAHPTVACKWHGHVGAVRPAVGDGVAAGQAWGGGGWLPGMSRGGAAGARHGEGVARQAAVCCRAHGG